MISNNYLNSINQYAFISLINGITRAKEIRESCLDHVPLYLRGRNANAVPPPVFDTIEKEKIMSL